MNSPKKNKTFTLNQLFYFLRRNKTKVFNYYDSFAGCVMAQFFRSKKLKDFDGVSVDGDKALTASGKVLAIIEFPRNERIGNVHYDIYNGRTCTGQEVLDNMKKRGWM